MRGAKTVKQMVKPPGRKIDTNGQNGKINNCDKEVNWRGLKGKSPWGRVANLIDFAPLPVIPFYQCRLILEKVDGCRMGPYSSGGGNGRRIMRTVKNGRAGKWAKMVKLVNIGKIGKVE